MKSKAIKEKDLERLRVDLGTARSAFVVQFHGLKVVDVDELRRKVREAGGRYHVVKNTLARKASGGTAVEGISTHLRGPTALVLAPEPSKVAKTLTEFAKANPAVSVKGGVFEGTQLDAEACKALAGMPTKEELISRLLYLLQSPLQRLATVLAAPSRNLAVVLGQVAGKKEG